MKHVSVNADYKKVFLIINNFGININVRVNAKND